MLWDQGVCLRGFSNVQSVKTTVIAVEAKGFDASKKVKGLKRHIVVDSLGFVLMVIIHSANVQDRDGPIDVLRGVKEMLGCDLEIFKRNELHAFKVLL